MPHTDVPHNDYSLPTLCRNPYFIALALVAAAALYGGWKLFWFLTDDAYIAFRYIGNSMDGYGYTWNPPPFRPVEGYTSFLWLVILELIWHLTGIQPPAAANWVSLLFAGGTLLVVARIVLRMDLDQRLARHRLWWLALVLLGTLSNRTFLAWTSSGLETAMFNFFVTLWLYLCVFSRPHDRRWLVQLAATAALIDLTRPDGLLFVAATLAIALIIFYQNKGRGSLLQQALPLLPLLATLLHLAWRRLTYGLWLPNTYYAKYVAAWPESGVRYLASFALEYALLIWLLAFVAWAWHMRHGIFPLSRHNGESFVYLLALATLVVHVLYYILRIGGDHFEYRVLSHLVPLLFVSFLWFLNRLPSTSAQTSAAVIAFILLSWPLPWMHWHLSQQFDARPKTHVMKVAVSEHLPSALAWYGETFDQLQFWLIEHRVCMRHQEHKVFQQYLERLVPDRESIIAQFGSNAAAIGPFPVFSGGSVGVIGWRLAPVIIIDTAGLNDYVVAKAPLAEPNDRKMAHDRTATQAYVDCFSPNVWIDIKAYDTKDRTDRYSVRRNIRIETRAEPLTAEKIRDCENRDWY